MLMFAKQRVFTSSSILYHSCGRICIFAYNPIVYKVWINSLLIDYSFFLFYFIFHYVKCQ